MAYRPTRRSVVGGLAVTMAAGCLGADEGEESTRTDWPDHDGTGPVPVPNPYDCDGVCGMNPATYPDWHAQLAHVDGTGAFFCSSGCLLSYLAVPDHAEAHDADVIDVWVRDVASGEWIDGKDAHWVLETDTDEQQPGEPMELNPRPFGDPSEATAYVDDRDHLDEETIATFDALDHDVAHRYRSSRLPPP